MADLKISQLTGATTPLAGTEVLPIVQGGATVKVSVANLTAGREVGMAGANSTDFIKVAAGKGLAYDLNTAVFMTPEDNIQGARIAAGGSFKLLVATGEAIDVNGTTKDVKVTAGNLVIGTAGKGIDFSADPSAAGMTSELLDDYEEGTFTPTMSSAAGTTTVNSANGRYTKIGNKVFTAIKIDYSTNASVSTSNLTIGALPFSSGSIFYFKAFVVESTWTGSDINDGNITGAISGTTMLWANRAVNQSSRTNAVIWLVAEYFAA